MGVNGQLRGAVLSKPRRDYLAVPNIAPMSVRII